MQEIKLQPFIQEVIQKNTTYHQEKALQTLVVTPSIKRNSKLCQTISSFNKCASLNQPITQERAQISDLLMESVSCDEKMKMKILHLY
jgi:hypothetical protein